jgi:hypothetical protein
MEKAEDALGGRLSGKSVVEATALPGYGREPVGRAGRFARKSFKYVAVETRVNNNCPFNTVTIYHLPT